MERRAAGARSARHRGRRTAGARWARRRGVVVVPRAPGRLVVVVVAVEPSAVWWLPVASDAGGRRSVGLVVERWRRPVEGVDGGVRQVGRGGDLDVGWCASEGGRPPLVLARLAGVRPDAVERVALRPGGRGGGNVRRAADRTAGTTGVGEGGGGHGGHHHVGQGADRRTPGGDGIGGPLDEGGQRPAGAGPATAGRPKASTWRRGPGQQAVDETAPRGDVVGGARTVEPRPPAQAGPAAVTEQDVRGLEPPVHDAEIVEVSQCRGHRRGEAADVGDRARPPRDGLAGVGGAQLAGRSGGSSAGRDRRLEVTARHEGHDAGVAGV